MKCSSCNIDVAKELKFCISQNKCPACGGKIVNSGSMSSFVALHDLISAFFGETIQGDPLNPEELATRIVTNFSVNQRGTKSEVVQPVLDEQAEPAPDQLDDEEYKKKQMAAARKALKQEAYEEALKAQYGMGEIEGNDGLFSSGLTDGEIVNPVLQANVLKQEFKRQQSLQNMESGAGKVKRSG